MYLSLIDPYDCFPMRLKCDKYVILCNDYNNVTHALGHSHSVVIVVTNKFHFTTNYIYNFHLYRFKSQFII